jgi:hypothetical protein
MIQQKEKLPPVLAYFAKRIVPLTNEEESKRNSTLRTSETLLINLILQLNLMSQHKLKCDLLKKRTEPLPVQLYSILLASEILRNICQITRGHGLQILSIHYTCNVIALDNELYKVLQHKIEGDTS